MADRSLPEVVGLCLQHAEQFYVPHGGVCPEPDCGCLLIEYRMKYEAEGANARVAELEALVRDVNWLLTHVVFADTFGPDKYERACDIDYRVRAASGEFSPVTKGKGAS